MSATLSAAITGATAGAALGPVGMAAGALLGAAPGLLSALGVHLFKEGTAGQALDLVRALTGKANPDGADMAGLSSDRKYQLQIGLAKIAADGDAADRAADIEEIKAGFADVAGARGQTVSLAQAGSKIAWGAPVVSVMVVGTFGGMLVALAMHATPPETKDLMNVMLGSLAASFGAVVQYWVGSSAGSRGKDATIHAMTQG